MDRERLDYWCEKGILTLILAMLVFSVAATGGVSNVSWLVVQALMCGVLLLWIPRFWTRSSYRFLFPPVAWGVLAFVIYVIVRYAQADVEYAARSDLLRILVYAFVVFAILDNLHGQEEMQKIVFTLVFVGMAVSLYAVYQFITDSPFVWNLRRPADYAHRASGTYICPNNLAGFLEMVLPLSLACVLIGRFKPTTKVFLGYAALAMLAGIAVTVSRAGWVAAGIALVFLFLMLLRNRTYRLPALVLLVLLIGGGVFFAKKTFQSQKRWDQLVVEGELRDMRFRLWGPTIQIWQEHFWWGAGPGHFDHAFRKHRPTDVQMRPLYAHNDYLNTLADYGTTGMTIIGVTMVLLAWSTLRLWKFVQRSNDIATKPSNRSALVLGSVIGLAALWVHSAADFNMHIPANALVAVTLIALLGAHVRFATERFWINPGWIGKLLGTAVVLAGLMFLGRDTVQGALQRWHYRQAQKALDNESKVTALKRAVQADPRNFELVFELGETLRLWSWQGLPGFERLAQEAMQWFELAAKLNPFDPYALVRYGMCLDWLGKHAEAEPYFAKAAERDPNNWAIVFQQGWHFFQVANDAESKVNLEKARADYEVSRQWFEKAQKLAWSRLDAKFPDRDKAPAFYLNMIKQRLADAKFRQ